MNRSRSIIEKNLLLENKHLKHSIITFRSILEKNQITYEQDKQIQIAINNKENQHLKETITILRDKLEREIDG